MEPFRFGTTVIGQMIRSMQRQKASILAVREPGYTTECRIQEKPKGLRL